MSRSNAQIRFPDGTILFGLYNGTVGFMFPRLFQTQGAAWDTFYPPEKKGTDDTNDYSVMQAQCQCGQPPEEVEIATDEKQYWPGLACRQCGCITDGLDPRRKLQRDIDKAVEEAEAEIDAARARGESMGYGAVSLMDSAYDDHNYPNEGLPEWWAPANKPQIP